jgi:hypothetical protein
MQIRLGYELIYDCPQPMLLMLNVHDTHLGYGGVRPPCYQPANPDWSCP